MNSGIAEGLKSLLLLEYGGSTFDMVEDFVRGTVSELQLAAEIGSSGLDLAIGYKKSLTGKN